MKQPNTLRNWIRATAAPLALAVGAVGAAFAGETPAKPESPIRLTVEGGIYRMFVQGQAAPTVRVDGPAGGVVELAARDAFGQPTGWKETVTLDGEGVGKVDFQDDLGYYRIDATLPALGAAAVTDIGVVAPQPAGARPESFFGSNTSHLRTGMELKLLNLIGMRVQRTHFSGWANADKPSNGGPIPMDFNRLDRDWAEVKASGSWALPLAGYALQGAKSPLANETGMHGPPRDFGEFIATYRVIIERYPEIKTWEFWNEPWIFGWTWAADAATYRQLQRMFALMLQDANPGTRLLAGNSSMFVEDHIEPYPDSWKGLIDGTTHHPYMGAGHPNFRRGGQGRSIDHGMVVTKRMGLPFYYLTEGGTEWRDPAAVGDDRNNINNARKVVHYTVSGALSGAYQSNVQFDIGYGPAWTLPNVAYATLASFIEDRPAVAEVWPTLPLLTGALFANPRHIDDAVRALPRAADLVSRWEVPVPEERANDPVKVVVLYALTGPSEDSLDTDGTLTFDTIGDLRAYDFSGREIPPVDGRLTVPFGEWPVYVTTSALSVVEFRDRVANARVEQLTPVNAYVLSLADSADKDQNLVVRIQNQLNRPLSGSVSLTNADGDRDMASVAEIKLDAGQLAEIPVAWKAVAKRNPDNQYLVNLAVKTDAGDYERQQVIATARFAKRTPTIDGDLADWEDLPSVLLDSDRLKGGLDLTRYLLNPHLERPTAEDGGQRSVSRLWTAYDDKNVYVAMAVNEDKFVNRAGQPAMRGPVQLPYRVSWADGLQLPGDTGDALFLAFGFRDRVPGWGRQMDDPWAWKGHFHDTDYQYAIHPSTDGPRLIRLWDADSARRTGFQTENESFIVPVPEAQLVLNRDEEKKLTIYELALPRAELKLFDPTADRLRFAFQLSTDEPIHASRRLRWAEAAGVFDFWWNSGSFGPSWEENLPCQTFFGIER